MNIGLHMNVLQRRPEQLDIEISRQIYTCKIKLPMGTTTANFQILKNDILNKLVAQYARNSYELAPPRNKIRNNKEIAWLRLL